MKRIGGSGPSYFGATEADLTNDEQALKKRGALRHPLYISITEEDTVLDDEN
jgi:hypothetical protein